MVIRINSLHRLVIAVYFLFSYAPIFANSCRHFYGAYEVPAFFDSRYADYEMKFSGLSPDDVVLISMQMNMMGISILNREDWRKRGLADEVDPKLPLQVRIVNKDQYDVIMDLASRKKGQWKIVQTGIEKYSSPLMQKFAGYLETGKIPVETVIQLDELSRGLISEVKLKVWLNIYQHEYTHENIEDMNRVMIARMLSGTNLKPSSTKVSIWGPKGDRHATVIGTQEFVMTLTDKSQIDFVLHGVSSGMGIKFDVMP